MTDRVLAVAHVMSDALRCPGCGEPKSECYSYDSEGYYDVQDATCNACNAVKRDVEGRDHDHARKVWVVNTEPGAAIKPWKP